MICSWGQRRCTARMWGGIVAASAMALVACSGPGNPNADSDASDADGAGLVSDTSEPSGSVDDNATFRYAHSVSPQSLDPDLSTSNYDRLYMFPVYDRLTYLTPEGELEPMLATSWEFADGDLVLELRDDVTFHDGEAFNASVVKQNLERSMNHPQSDLSDELSAIDRVEVENDTTVRLVLNGPGGALPNLLSEQAGAMISPGALENDDLDVNPVGSGPWELVDYQLGDRLTYEATDDHWNPEAQGVQALELVVQTDDDTRLNALQSGQLDATFIREPMMPQAENAELNVMPVPNLNHVNIVLNSARSEFDKPEVRAAIQHAINRDALTDATFGQLECAPSSQPWAEGYWAQHPDMDADYWEYDPELARSLLADAGLEDGFSFELLVPNVSAYPPVAEVIKSDLEAVGIDASIRIAESLQVREEFEVEKSVDALLSAWPGGADPSLYIADTHMPGGSLNPGGNELPGLAELHREAMQSFEQDERAEIYHEITELIFDKDEPGTAIVICMRSTLNTFAGHVDGGEHGMSNITGSSDWRGLVMYEE